MPDAAEKKTDEILARMERKLDKVYKQAAKETKQKYLDYVKKFEADDAIQRKKLAAGEITDEQYKNWRERKMFTGKKYQEMANTLAQDLATVDQKAMSIVNGFLPEAYAVNYNFMAYELGKAGVPLGASFTLYDRHTVEKLMRERKLLLPKPRVEIPKDERWNVAHIKNAITQGILQGESIPHIADRLQKVVGMDRAAAIRNGRTAMTGAQNGGRVDRMKDANKRGLNVMQEWCATHDARARDSHLALDGHRIRPGMTFPNGCRYPGDPQGEPSEVYNCRCTLLPYLPDYDFESGTNDKDEEEFDNWLDYMSKGAEPFETKIQRLQREVERSNLGLPSEEQIKEAGEALAKEYDKFIAEANATVKEQIAQLEKDIETFDKQILKLDEKIDAARDTMDYALVADLKDEQAYIMDMRFQSVLKHSRLSSDGVTISQEDNVNWLTKQIAKFREVGTSGLDIDEHLNHSRSPMTPIVKEAYSHYPKSWVEKSIARGNLTPQKVNRGYYDDWNGVIAISFRTPTQAQGTAIHELAHRFERAVPGIQDAEETFYNRRTAGETLQWLGQGYDRSEMTRFDNFIHPYMGKDYGGQAYELVSMGFQYAYTDPARLAKDPDMQAWIYGQLLLMP